MICRSHFATFLLLLGHVASGCATQCLQSSDIQVSVVPDPDLDPAQISKLHVALSVNGAQAKSLLITPKQTIDRSGAAFILQPDSTPARAMYTVTVTIEAMDASGNIIAIGSDSEQVLAKGCNRLTAHLAALPTGGSPPGDMATTVSMGNDMDMAGVVVTHPDMAGCIGGMPDEDNDGRSNSCDLCPADYDPTPTDSDADGLPDACDPDTTKATNRLVYFDPFDVDSGHWAIDVATSMLSVPSKMSYMLVDSGMNTPLNKPVNASNSVDLVPLNVRVQTFAAPQAVWYSGSPPPVFAELGIFLGNGTNPYATGTNGVLCQVRLDHRNGFNNDAVRIVSFVNGNPSSCITTPTDSATAPSCTTASPTQPRLTFPITNFTTYRFRLTQRGNQYSCEVQDDSGNNYVLSPLTATSGQTQNIVLEETNLVAQYNSVVAETALP